MAAALTLSAAACGSGPAAAPPRRAGGPSGTTAQPPPAQLQTARQQMTARLQEAWRPTCPVEGGSGLKVRLRFRLENGRVAGRPEVVGGPSSDPVVRAAEERAVRAVYSAGPYDWLPEVMQNGDYQPVFNAEAACR